MPRDLVTLPKAHLHLHFTGSMRPNTLAELATLHRVRLPFALQPEALGDPVSATLALPTPEWTPDRRGWYRFQRLYDVARQVIRTDNDARRLVLEAAEDDAREGSGWLELQVDPSGYAGRWGTLSDTLETVLDAARDAAAVTGVGIGIVVGANRTRHPLDARALARLAARHAGVAANVGVVGFGLANDERAGVTADFAPAFRIARDAGLACVPHAGELLGPDSVRACLQHLTPSRLGHGVRAAEDPRLLDQLAERGIACEVCPASNVSLGVFAEAAEVPLRAMVEAGVRVALGADDPLLFGSRLLAQYHLARAVHGFDDAGLAGLAASSVRASLAPEQTKQRLLSGIAAWLAAPDPAS